MRYVGIILSVLGTVYGLFYIRSWGDLTTGWRIAIMLVAAGTIISTIYGIKDFLADKHEKEVRSKFGIFHNPKHNQSTMIIRGSGVQITSILNSVGIDKLLVYKYADRLYAQAIIYDDKGDLVAVVKGDYWQLFKDGYDYNNDDKGFEIITGDDRVLFQLDMTSNGVEVAGLLMNGNKSGCFLSPAKGNGAAYMTIIINGQVNGTVFQLPANLIDPIFKYPRERFVNNRVRL